MFKILKNGQLISGIDKNQVSSIKMGST